MPDSGQQAATSISCTVDDVQSSDSVRVLIVDDSPETRFAYRRFLAKHDKKYQFREAETVADAIKKLQTESFDCILLDFQLPDANGLELLEYLRSAGAIGDTPVIVTTSQGSESVAVAAMKLGAKDYLVKGSIDAPGLVAAVDKALIKARIEREQARTTQQLQTLSVTDSLTQLHNRRYLIERLDAELSRMSRYHTATSVLMIDLDHFKSVNDTHGHLVGDQVLITFGQMLKGLARTTDVIARLGGEEFCLVLCNTDVAGAMSLAHRVCAEARKLQHRDRNGNVFQVTCSAGLVEATAADLTCDEILHKSDVALYMAKRQGRDHVCVYESKMEGPNEKTA